MRWSVVVTLVFLALIALGIRQHGKFARPSSGPGKTLDTVVAKGTWKPDAAAARADALHEASALLSVKLALRTPALHFEPSPEYISAKLVRDSEVRSYRDDNPADADEQLASLRRQTLTIAITDELLAEAPLQEQTQRGRERLGLVSRLLAFAVLLFGTVAGCSRLDELSRGFYTGRLRFAATLVLAGGTAALLYWL